MDLCDVLDADEVVRATDGLKRIDKAAMRRALDAATGREARTTLRFMVEDGPRRRSDLERAFKDFATRFDLPEPRCNVWVAGLLVDCFWPEQELVVELDSQSWHAHMGARRNDFDRDAKVQRAGLAAVRMAWADLHHQPHRGHARIKGWFS